MADITQRVSGLMALFGMVVAVMNYSIGFNADWMSRLDDSTSVHAGLWHTCSTNLSGLEICSSLEGKHIPDYLVAVQGFELLTLVGLIPGSLSLIISLAVPNIQTLRVQLQLITVEVMTIYNISVMGVAGMCCLVTIATYGAYHELSHLSSGFYLDTSVLVCLVVTSTCTYTDYRILKKIINEQLAANVRQNLPNLRESIFEMYLIL